MILAWHMKWLLPVSNAELSWMGQDSPLTEVCLAASILYWQWRLQETFWVRHFSVGNHPRQSKVLPTIWMATFFLPLPSPVLGKQEKQCVVFLITNGFKGFVLVSFFLSFFFSPCPVSPCYLVPFCCPWVNKVGEKGKTIPLFFLFPWGSKNLLNGEPFFYAADTQARKIAFIPSLPHGKCVYVLVFFCKPLHMTW